MDMNENGSQLHELFHTGVRNLHTLEVGAIELTERQVERLENYPEMAARLRQHNVESKAQAERLVEILNRHETTPSAAKNTVGAVVGNVAAALHAPAPDEVLKNTFANFAFEHQEIASYTSLITMAEKIGDTASLAPLRQSLSEEVAMAKWIGEQIVPTTVRYMELSAAGQKAAV